MKKHFLFALIVIMIVTETNAQNVGIGTTSPKEKLDVNGNVNIAGTIKANGTPGTNGQVLTSTGTGMNWTSLGSTMGYKHCQMFLTSGTSSFTVPAGVTEIMAEVWGGGSGGYWTESYHYGTYPDFKTINSLGGTSGSYARTIQTVSPGITINIQVGSGGWSGSFGSVSLNGFSSSVDFPNGKLVAVGGGVSKRLSHDWGTTDGYLYASDRLYVETNAIDASKSASTGEVANQSYFINGNLGITGYNQFQALGGESNYIQTVYYGNGASPVGMLNSSETFGGFKEIFKGYTLGYQMANKSAIPSAGGGGNGGSGASGMVIVWWN